MLRFPRPIVSVVVWTGIALCSHRVRCGAKASIRNQEVTSWPKECVREK